MSVLKAANPSPNKKSSDRYFGEIRKKDDSIFSIDDARDIIKMKKKGSSANSEENTFEKKKDILSKQPQHIAQQKVGIASIADILGFNPIQNTQTRVHEKSIDEIRTKHRKYYKLLLKLKDVLKKDLSKLTNDNLAISVGKIKQDGIDAEIESFDSEFAISLMSNEQEALTEIEEAIQRVYDGTYGICELTGKPIETERLLAVPCARFSIEGQREKEKIKQAEVARRSIFQLDQSDDELTDFETENDE